MIIMMKKGKKKLFKVQKKKLAGHFEKILEKDTTDDPINDFELVY